jgi:DNA anti-recombination protein RmuC
VCDTTIIKTQGLTMKKTLILVTLLSVTTFSAMADELKTMTQEQAKVQTQNQVHNQEKEVQWQSTTPDEQVPKKENPYGQGTESKKLDQPQDKIRNQVRTQTKTRSQMQNRIQPMQPQMGNRMQTHTGGSGSRGH